MATQNVRAESGQPGAAGEIEIPEKPAKVAMDPPLKSDGRAEAGDMRSKASEAFEGPNPERLAHNIALFLEQAGKALRAYLEPREKGEIKNTFPDTLSDMTNSIAQVSEAWLQSPEKAVGAQNELWRSYLDLWSASTRRL